MAGVTFKEPIEFDWDEGNLHKNFIKHGVTDQECEESFFDLKKIVLKDRPHSLVEKRYILLGITKGQRLLYTVFTFRKYKIRIISARYVSKRERKIYEEKT